MFRIFWDLEQILGIVVYAFVLYFFIFYGILLGDLWVFGFFFAVGFTLWGCNNSLYNNLVCNGGVIIHQGAINKNWGLLYLLVL